MFGDCVQEGLDNFGHFLLLVDGGRAASLHGVLDHSDGCVYLGKSKLGDAE